MNEQILYLMNDEEFDVAEGDEQIQLLKQKATRKRGRGFELTSIVARDERTPAFRRNGRLPSANDDCEDDFSPQRSVEGWLLLATNIHEEAQEDDILNKFGNYGVVKNLHLNLDRRTGFVKGYAFVEYETYKEAVVAKKASNYSQFLGQTIKVDWAISQKPFRVQTYLSCHRKRKTNK